MQMAIRSNKPRSKVNASGNYTKPGLRKKIFNHFMASVNGVARVHWFALKAQMVAKKYKAQGGGYKS